MLYLPKHRAFASDGLATTSKPTRSTWARVWKHSRFYPGRDRKVYRTRRSLRAVLTDALRSWRTISPTTRPEGKLFGNRKGTPQTEADSKPPGLGRKFSKHEGGNRFFSDQLYARVVFDAVFFLEKICRLNSLRMSFRAKPRNPLSVEIATGKGSLRMTDS
ncbi:MAG: hypothetical protein Q8N81_08245 [bacterium]|nr:hypothetical protein [bacterium]